MNEMLREQSKKYITSAIFEWIGWIIGSVLLVMLVKWLSVQYGAPEQEFHIWISGIVYLWYISTMSLIIGGTYFIARAAQTHLERRQKHPQKPESVDLTKDIDRVKRIKKHAGVIAIILHTINAVFVYYVTSHIPGITPEFRLYAVIGVFAIAAIKPGFAAMNTIRIEIWGMLNEADYPVNSIAELWRIVTEFGDYEKRLEGTYSEIENAREEHEQLINDELKNVKGELIEKFKDEINTFKQSDAIREKAYTELKDAQRPVIKEIAKVLEAIQVLKDFVIDLRNKNIKGEQLMSALKEFGIDSLADLNVSFEKSVVNRNPEIRQVNSED